MLEKLDWIDWEKLVHLYGSAEDVPHLIRNLTSSKVNVRQSAWSGLYSSILYEGGVCEATALAVPFLIELLESESVLDRHKILNYLVELANATCYLEECFEDEELDEDFYPEGIRINREKNWVKETRIAVQRGIPVYTKLISDPDPKIRSTATYILANIGIQREKVVSYLRSLLKSEQDPLVLARIVLSLSELRDDHPQIITFMNESIEAGASLLGVTSALAILRNDPNHLKAIQLLVDVLNNPDEKSIELYQELPPFTYWLIREIFLCFRKLPQSYTKPYIPNLISVFQNSKKGYVSLAWILLSIVFCKQQVKLTVKDLNKEQISVLQAMAELDLLWQGSTYHLEMYGLPYVTNQEELHLFLNS